MNYLIIYGVVMCSLVACRELRQRVSIERFLVAERRVQGVLGAMSVAASWIWAPAIFVSTRVGYEWGFSGLVWFVIPNMLALVLFAPLAKRIRERLPEGYSYIGSISGLGGAFREIQLALQLGLQVVIFAIQLTAGAELLAAVTGSSYYRLAAGMALIPCLYASYNGLRTSVFTDAVQYAVIAASAVCLVLAFPQGASPVTSYSFHPFEPRLLMSFGISSALGLIVAIFADHQQWQRAFAARSDKVVPTFWLAALFHGVVTVSLGTLGVLVASVAFNSGGSQLELVGVRFVQSHYPVVFEGVFVIMALCALISTLDAGLCAFSSLVSTELYRGKDIVPVARRWMYALAFLGLGIALLRPSLLTLWFLAGTIRLSSFVPTIASILVPRFRGIWGSAAILTALPLGGTVFALGIWQNDPSLRTEGMIISLTVSLIVTATCAVLARLRMWQRNSAASPVFSQR